jgi:hypothetical protein
MPKFTITYTILKQVPSKQILVSFDLGEPTFDTAARAILHNEFPHLFFRFSEEDGRSAENALKKYAITDIKISHVHP